MEPNSTLASAQNAIGTSSARDADILMVVVEERSRATPQNNWKPETKSLLLGSGPKLPAAPASPNTTTTQAAPTCPECGGQRTWKDGIRYTVFGEIQRYICRNCSYRFSQSDPNHFNAFKNFNH